MANLINAVDNTANSTLNVGYQSVGKKYTFLSRKRNELYNTGKVAIPLRSCLLHNKSPENLTIITQPKWITDLFAETFDYDTGEYTAEVYQTNSFKSSNGRKIKALDKFCKHFQPLYRNKSVTLLFYTLTCANQSKTDIKGVMHTLRKRLQRKGVKMYGYIWTSEVSEELHWHYHFCLSTERLKLKGQKLPKYLKVDDVWGARCQVEFVKKNVRHYMAKYFAKHNFKILNDDKDRCIRSYGLSIPRTIK
jgi:hypothetical protein